MLNIVLVAIGGALGSVARYAAGIAAGRWLGLGFPYGTLFVNITGSLAMGVLIAMLARRLDASPELRLFLAVGFLGGYTTFSSFTLDAVSIWQRGDEALALAYVLLSIVVGLAALVAGMALVRHLG